MSVIRVLVADDQALVRAGLAALLDLEPDLTVVAQAADGHGAVALAAQEGVDVALLDIEMPGLTGLEATEQIVAAGRGTRCLIVTTFDRPGYLRRAFDAGASGFVVKDTPAPELAEAIRRVHAGLRVVDPALAEKSLLAGPNPLTARERDVLRKAAGGAPAGQIARALHLSAGTVRNHLSSAIGKTGTANRTEAATVAARNGWL
ncbi:DNA-binding response regulator [Kocuria tytonicola]|uniref:DNA-binding response regulator n=1 Tax=Kocuria tytonicola TaxID=2055946 RepID=A0A3L9L710_9MICC|nr:response regulator transcription factor [Kocuria tytonicola]RLY94485.1 DNA-binding response regulator [Kocuria tytonicola]